MNAMDPSGDRGPAPTRAVLFGFGAAFVLAGLLYNELLVLRVVPEFLRTPETVRGVRSSQLALLGIGAMLLVASEVVRRTRLGRRLAARPSVPSALVVTLTLLGSLSLLELGLRPVVGRGGRTTIFERDPELGWRLRPGAVDEWGGVIVRINARGLRGPELEYEKRPGVTRVLYLGDSVTFGYGLESWEHAYPHLASVRLAESTGAAVETVNAGVGGYSPWQELAYLKREGIRYDPDLVVVAFVPNDVTEKLALTRFGGAGEGWQLRHTASLLERSALVRFARKIGGRLRFGRDTARGAAERELTDVRKLEEDPHRAELEHAWRVTLDNLGGIFDYCSDRGVPVALAVFPFRFQTLPGGGEGRIQAVVTDFADGRGVPVIDLLPALLEDAERSGADPGDYFLDGSHLSAAGSRVVAEALAGFLSREVLPGP